MYNTFLVEHDAFRHDKGSFIEAAQGAIAPAINKKRQGRGENLTGRSVSPGLQDGAGQHSGNNDVNAVM